MQPQDRVPRPDSTESVSHLQTPVPVSQSTQKSPPIGRLLRGLLGVLCLYLVATNIQSLNRIAIFEAVGTAAGFITFYVILQSLILRFPERIKPWVGAIRMAILPAALVFVLGNGAVMLGAFFFFGVSLVLAAVRGDPGCEVMSIPSMLWRRHTQLLCPIFSPLDTLERKIYTRIANQN